jgi:hypothetical protein
MVFPLSPTMAQVISIISTQVSDALSSTAMACLAPSLMYGGRDGWRNKRMEVWCCFACFFFFFFFFFFFAHSVSFVGGGGGTYERGICHAGALSSVARTIHQGIKRRGTYRAG